MNKRKKHIGEISESALINRFGFTKYTFGGGGSWDLGVVGTAAGPETGSFFSLKIDFNFLILWVGARPESWERLKINILLTILNIY